MKKTENTAEEQTGKKPGLNTWSYKESFIIACTLILLGFIIEIVFQEHQFPVPIRPYNLFILISGILFLSLVHFFFRKTAFIKWFASIPCSISAIVSFAGLVFLLGIIRQEGEGQQQWMQLFGLNHIKNSWPFLFIELYLFVSLGLVVLRRFYPFSRKNLGFLLNHFGLWLTLVAAVLGSGDLQRLKVNIFENRDFSDKGLETGHIIYNLPFSIKLLDFRMEMYNPTIVLTDSLGGSPGKQKGESQPIIEKGSEYKLKNFRIRVLNILSSAARTDSGYVPSDEPMAAVAALVHVENLVSGDSVTNWLCSGSKSMLPEYILLEKNLGLWLRSPEPEKFESDVVVKTKPGNLDTVTIEVNKPFRTGGWSIYQFGYDENAGPASEYSIIEAVYDPWLPLVYTGILMMIAGACYLFWERRGE